MLAGGTKGIKVSTNIDSLTANSCEEYTVRTYNVEFTPAQHNKVLAEEILRKIGADPEEVMYNIGTQINPTTGNLVATVIIREGVEPDHNNDHVEPDLDNPAVSWTIDEAPDDEDAEMYHTGAEREQIIETGAPTPAQVEKIVLGSVGNVRQPTEDNPAVFYDPTKQNIAEELPSYPAAFAGGDGTPTTTK